MKRALQASGIIAMLAVAFAASCLGALLIEARKTAQTAGAHLATVADQASLTFSDARKVLVNADKASEQQRRYWFVLDRRMSRALKSVDNLVRNADQNLNGPRGSLPAFARAIESNSTNVATLTQQATLSLSELGESSHSALRQLQNAIGDMDDLANDPNIKLAIGQLAESSRNTNKSTADIAAILEDLRHPQKPSKFIRALSFALGLLRTSGQSAPLFR